MKGYIYTRFHWSLDVDDICKFGKTICIPDRDSQYATGEAVRGYFAHVWEVLMEDMDMIENVIKEKFHEYNTKHYNSDKFTGGIEFFNKKIISKIEPCLEELGYTFRKLTLDEIENLIRTYRKSEAVVKYNRRCYQIDIIKKSVNYFQENDKGLLVLVCGIGKTLISLWIAQDLNCKKIVIGVPNRLLLEQWQKVICILFAQIPYLIVSDGVNCEDIDEFLIDNPKSCIIITTYTSAHKLSKTSVDNSFEFDMKINDECHHLTSHNMKKEQNTKTFIEMLKVPSKRQLSLTATLKQLESDSDDFIVVSNDNVDFFGDVIDKKCLSWAIQQNIICDYLIQTLTTKEENLSEIFSKFYIDKDNHKRLFLSSYAALKSIAEGHSHHLLIYSNNKENSSRIEEYMKLLLEENYFDLPDLYYSAYYSGMKSNSKEVISNFEKSRFGIISCVYCLGEGWDFPLLDGVVFAENMTSNVRIVQSALRPLRKNPEFPEKIGKIILPVLNTDNWLDNDKHSDFNKIKQVIYLMGFEDETISQKIKAYQINFEKQKIGREKDTTESVQEIGTYDDELTHKLRLKTTKKNALGTSYEKAIKIIANKNIKSTQEYFQLCDQDNRLFKEPQVVFKDKFTNWFDYFSLDRDDYYDFQSCKSKIKQYLHSNTTLKDHYLDLFKICNLVCQQDSKFPPAEFWVECYGVKDLRELIDIPKKKSIGVF